MTRYQDNSDRTLRSHLIAGVATLVLLAGGLGGWAATTELSGAVVAQGRLVVDSNVKKVQHPTGGVVGEIRVKDGDHVKAGEIIVRLDETVTKSNLAVITKAMDELAVRQGRLEAERDGRGTIEPRGNLESRAADPEVARLLAGEKRLFELRREAREGQEAQLRERIAQFREQIEGLEEQANAKTQEIRLIEQELEGVRELWRKQLVPINRVMVLEREGTRLKGERGQLVAAVAEAKGKISETGLKIIQIDQDLRSEVAKELREIEAKVAELVEKRVAAEDHLRRIDIRAPQDGVVHQLAIHTVGGVVSPGDPLMLVVPEADELAVEVKVAPQDIDQLQGGQEALLRLSAFNQRTTPQIKGVVSRIAADLSKDDKTGQSFYTVRVMADKAELSRLPNLKLVPGMPVDAFVKTGDRTVISYLMKPLTDQIMRAFREE